MVDSYKKQGGGRYLIFNDASLVMHQGGLATGASVFIDRLSRNIDLIAMFNFGYCSEDINAIERRTVLEGLKLQLSSSVFATFTDSRKAMERLAFVSGFIDSEDHSTPNLSDVGLLETDMELFAQSVQKNPQMQFARISREHSLLVVADEFANRARNEVDRGSFSRPSVKTKAFPVKTFLDIRLLNLGFSETIAGRAEQDFDDLVTELS